MKTLRCLRLALPTLLVALAALSAHAEVSTRFVFLNGFSGLNEQPAPNASSGSYIINAMRYVSAGGTRTNGHFDVNITFSGLSANAIAAHVHGFTNTSGAAGVLPNGGTFTATPATSGTISGSWNPASASDLTNLYNGLVYLNIHSTAFPGGEWRGQVVPFTNDPVYAPALSISVGTNGNPILRVDGQSNWFYFISSSSNLMDWTRVHTGFASNGVVLWADTNTLSIPRRFYRATP